MTWILLEEEALHNQLKGLTVSDEKNAARPVGVWFGLPDSEIRQQNYPFITIDMLGLTPELDRATGGPFTKLSQDRPEAIPLPTSGTTARGELPPTPYSLEYQVATWARFPRHDRQILAALLGGVLPHRYGSLPVPADSSIRRLDLIGLTKRDSVDRNGRRLFRNVFTIRISSELYYWQVAAIEKTRLVTITLTDK